MSTIRIGQEKVIIYNRSKKLTSNYNRDICVIVNTHGSIWDWAKFGAAEGSGGMQGWCWDDRNVTPSRYWGRKKGFIPPRQVRDGKRWYENKKKWIIVSNWVFLSTSYRNAVSWTYPQERDPDWSWGMGEMSASRMMRWEDQCTLLTRLM